MAKKTKRGRPSKNQKPLQQERRASVPNNNRLVTSLNYLPKKEVEQSRRDLLTIAHQNLNNTPWSPLTLSSWKKLRTVSPQTALHCKRVRQLSLSFLHEFLKEYAQEDLDPETHNKIEMQMENHAQTHDLGKLFMPELVNHPGKLTTKDFKKIKQHPILGAKLLKNEHPTARKLALSHHERPDGKGYPYGVPPSDVFSKIITISDVYDAITSKRAYDERKKLSPKKLQEEALTQIKEGAGSQFDPFFALQFIKMVKEGRVKTPTN
ncbi:MAG: HD-GYP domain-containing protein [Candidatus Micrarchaeia archaeon]